MQAGDRIQQYVFVEKLGEGGMAEVWKATDTNLDDDVAIKFLLPHIARNADLVERFRNEGRRQAQLKHKNILHVRQYLEHENQVYLVMDYKDGGALDRYLDASPGPLPLEDVLRLALPVLSALSLAHSKGVIHRDISPQNVLLDSAGIPYLTDFGIARVLGDHRVTRTGTVMGKCHYMSPEQILKPVEADHRSDIYSFGVLLYEMLTGRVPFDADEGDIEFHVKAMHLNAPPPSLRSIHPEVPENIESVVLWALEKDPAKRPQSCQELADALVQAEAGLEPPPPPLEPSLPKPKRTMAAAALFLLGAAVAGVWYSSTRSTPANVAATKQSASVPTEPPPPAVAQPKPDQPRPAISFASHPPSARYGGSVTLRWNVRHARRVLLDDRVVEASGSQVMSGLTGSRRQVLTAVGLDGNSTRATVNIQVATAEETAIEACTAHGLSSARCRKDWDECRAAGISENKCFEQLR